MPCHLCQLIIVDGRSDERFLLRPTGGRGKSGLVGGGEANPTKSGVWNTRYGVTVGANREKRMGEQVKPHLNPLIKETKRYRVHILGSRKARNHKRDPPLR